MLMTELPSGDRSLLLRTDFADEQAWNRLRDAVQKPSEEGFLAYFDYVDNLSYEGLTIKERGTSSIGTVTYAKYLRLALPIKPL